MNEMGKFVIEQIHTENTADINDTAEEDALIKKALEIVARRQEEREKRINLIATMLQE